jgi:uncharacterized small protein (DUF1192 family)
MGQRFDALDTRVTGLEDRLVDRTHLLRTDIAGMKAETAIEQANGKDAADALRQHIGDEIAHRRAA